MSCHNSPTMLSFRESVNERALTWGPILKRSAGMGNVRASSDEESAPPKAFI